MFFNTKKTTDTEPEKKSQDNIDLQIINKMNLVKRDEFDVLKKMVQKLIIENDKLNKTKKKTSLKKKKAVSKKNKLKN